MANQIDDSYTRSVVGGKKPLPKLFATFLTFSTNVPVAQETPDVWLYKVHKEVVQGDVLYPVTRSQL